MDLHYKYFDEISKYGFENNYFWAFVIHTDSWNFLIRLVKFANLKMLPYFLSQYHIHIYFIALKGGSCVGVLY